MRKRDECSFCGRGMDAPCVTESDMAGGDGGCREALTAWRTHVRYLQTGRRTPEWTKPVVRDARAGNGQVFVDLRDYERHADAWLAPDEARGAPVCLDAKGRVVASMDDAGRAAADGAFPLRWFWPDQLVPALGEGMAALAAGNDRIAKLERWCGLANTTGRMRESTEQSLEWQARFVDAQREHVMSIPVGG